MDNFQSTITGAISAIGLGKWLGVIAFNDFSKAFLIGFIGAMGGLLAKQLFDKILKKKRIK